MAKPPKANKPYRTSRSAWQAPAGIQGPPAPAMPSVGPAGMMTPMTPPPMVPVKAHSRRARTPHLQTKE